MKNLPGTFVLEQRGNRDFTCHQGQWHITFTKSTQHSLPPSKERSNQTVSNGMKRPQLFLKKEGATFSCLLSAVFALMPSHAT